MALLSKDRMPSLQAHGNQVVVPNQVRIIFSAFELLAHHTMVVLENASLKLSEACGPGELVDLDEPQETFVKKIVKERIPDGVNSTASAPTLTTLTLTLTITLTLTTDPNPNPNPNPQPLSPNLY